MVPLRHHHVTFARFGRAASAAVVGITGIVLAGCRESPVAPPETAPYLNHPRAIALPATPTTWYMRRADNGFDAVQFGLSDDVPVQRDYDGDGKFDVAVFRPGAPMWYILRSSDLQTIEVPYGLSTDTPVPADYDGDGRADVAVFRRSTGTWYYLASGTGETAIIPFGASTDVVVPADYDGDGRADLAIYRPATQQWWIRRSSNQQIDIIPFGLATDVPVPADFDGDGKADLAVWRAGAWWIRQSSTQQVSQITWGNASDAPVPGDYDHDGEADVAIWRSSSSQWWVRRSSDAGTSIIDFGLPGDVPVPGRYAAGGIQPAVVRAAPQPPAPQVITFTSSAPSSAALGSSYVANATGGASGNPVTYTSLTPDNCSVSGASFTFTAIGTCTIAADQAGNAAYLPAPQATQSVAVVYPFAFSGAPSVSGNGVNVAFSLGGNRGANPLTAGSLTMEAGTCTVPFSPTGAATPATLQGSGVSYSSRTGLYSFVWKVDRKAWAGTCRRLSFATIDGARHELIVQF